MEASPVSVVFNGVPVGTTREVRVLVVNKRHHLVRFRLATCSKNAQPLPSAFEVLIPRLGQVAAGMGQPVSILYTPTELKRITASIVLESEYDQLVIPIEVFPIKTSIIAPAEVAFGDVAVAAKIVKVRGNMRSLCIRLLICMNVFIQTLIYSSYSNSLFKNNMVFNAQIYVHIHRYSCLY